jgi:hypothetical protein
MLRIPQYPDAAIAHIKAVLIKFAPKHFFPMVMIIAPALWFVFPSIEADT